VEPSEREALYPAIVDQTQKILDAGPAIEHGPRQPLASQPVPPWLCRPAPRAALLGLLDLHLALGWRHFRKPLPARGLGLGDPKVYELGYRITR
jgi:hypothetical protein